MKLKRMTIIKGDDLRPMTPAERNERRFSFWLTGEARDSQDEILLVDGLLDDAVDWVEKYGGVIHRGHTNQVVGRALKVEKRPYDGPRREYHGIPAIYGEGIIFRSDKGKGRVFDETWEMLRAGELGMVSLGGEGGKERTVCDDEQCTTKHTIVEETDVIYEMALVERGANPVSDIVDVNHLAKDDEADKGCDEDYKRCVARLTPEHGRESAEAICANQIYNKDIAEAVKACASCDELMTKLTIRKGSVAKAMIYFESLVRKARLSKEGTDMENDEEQVTITKEQYDELLQKIKDLEEKLSKAEDDEEDESSDDEDEEKADDEDSDEGDDEDEEEKTKAIVAEVLKALEARKKAEAERKAKEEKLRADIRKQVIEDLKKEGVLSKSYTPRPDGETENPLKKEQDPDAEKLLKAMETGDARTLYKALTGGQ